MSEGSSKPGGGKGPKAPPHILAAILKTGAKPSVHSQTKPTAKLGGGEVQAPLPILSQKPQTPQLAIPDSTPVVLLDGSAAPQDEMSQPASLSEIVAYAALDSIFFCRHFFPKTFRQESPGFHRDIWELLDDPTARYINIQVQRDGAKTTLLRSYAAKRIAYGLSRTILYIGASQDKAKASVGWLKTQIERNKLFTSTFGLSASRNNWTNERLQRAAFGLLLWALLAASVVSILMIIVRISLS